MKDNAMERRLAAVVSAYRDNGGIVRDGILLRMLAHKGVIELDGATNKPVWFWGRCCGVARYIDKVLQGSVDTGVNVYNIRCKYFDGCFSPYVHVTLQRKSEVAA